jgi:hypothetical protein
MASHSLQFSETAVNLEKPSIGGECRTPIAYPRYKRQLCPLNTEIDKL